MVRPVSPFVLAIAAVSVGCGGGSSPVTAPSTATPSLQDVQRQVRTPRCAVPGCHIGSSAPFALDMSSVSSSSVNLIGAPSAERPGVFRVAPGDAANSYVVWKVTGSPAIGGDRMPLSGGPLSGGDLALIAAWIDGGAR